MRLCGAGTALGARLADGIVETLRSAGLPVTVNRVGSLVGLFLTEGEVGDFESARAMDRALYARLFHALLRRGVYWAPSPLEALFVSSAHGESDIDETLAALREACAELAAA